MAKRDYKTVPEWKKAYRDQAQLMNERGYRELQPTEFYRAIFPEGSLQSRVHDGKGNILATQIRPSGKGRTKQWVIDDSLDMLDKVIRDSFGLIPPLSFYGKPHTNENAHQPFAMATDIDPMAVQPLTHLLPQVGTGAQLC
ncbi:repa, partial [Clostridioides difficile]